MELLSNHSDREGLRAMSQKDLVELLAEGYTRTSIARGFCSKGDPRPVHWRTRSSRIG
jgi:hypothetical protein